MVVKNSPNIYLNIFTYIIGRMTCSKRFVKGCILILKGIIAFIMLPIFAIAVVFN